MLTRDVKDIIGASTWYRINIPDKPAHQKLFNFLIDSNCRCKYVDAKLHLDNLEYLSETDLDSDTYYQYEKARIKSGFSINLKDFIQNKNYLIDKFLNITKSFVVYEDNVIDLKIDNYKKSIVTSVPSYTSISEIDELAGRQILDYGTRDLVDINEPFDLSKTCNFYFNKYLYAPHNDLCKTYYNSYGEIVEISPREYFDICLNRCYLKINSPTLEQLIKSRTYGITYYEKVLIEDKKTFPIPFIDMRSNQYYGQEGLHRMLALANLTSWNKKFPVLVVKKSH